MSLLKNSRIKLPRSLQFCPQCFIFRTNSLNAANGHSNARPEPTPSQLLRFSLTGTTQRLQVSPHRSELDELLDSFIIEPWPTKSPLPPWRASPRNVIPSSHQQDWAALKNAMDLRDLHLYVEREISTRKNGKLLSKCYGHLSQALLRCQQHHSSKEILTFLNALMTRLQKVGVPLSKDIYFIGMHHACLSFSVLALKNHIDGYRRVTNGRLQQRDSETLINSLLSTLRLLLFEDPDYDRSGMLSLFTGESQTNQDIQHTLRDVLCDLSGKESSATVVEKFVLLLGMLRGRQLLHSVWNMLKEEISPGCDQKLITTAYACVTAFIDMGQLKAAMACLTEISERANKKLPGISKEPRLVDLIIDHNVSALLLELAGKEESMALLDSQLRTIETRLGLEWQEDQSFHSKINDLSHLARSQPLLTVDGESVGLQSTQRFVAEIRALGCSNSSSDLGIIANLLDEHEGEEIPLFSQYLETELTVSAWIPQRSPIEFSDRLRRHGRDNFDPWDPVSLGLIRARLDGQGKPLADEHTLHLLQLGYMVMRPATDRKQREWVSSGHIITWDRVNGEFVIIFVNISHGIIFSSFQPSSPQSISEIGVVSTIVIPQRLYTFNRTMAEILVHKRTQGVYHFDVDRSRELVP